MPRKVIVDFNAKITLVLDEGTSVEDVMSILDVIAYTKDDIDIDDFKVENYEVIDSK